jgi:hypothetical protein
MDLAVFARIHQNEKEEQRNQKAINIESHFEWLENTLYSKTSCYS